MSEHKIVSAGFSRPDSDLVFIFNCSCGNNDVSLSFGDRVDIDKTVKVPPEYHHGKEVLSSDIEDPCLDAMVEFLLEKGFVDYGN